MSKAIWISDIFLFLTDSVDPSIVNGYDQKRIFKQTKNRQFGWEKNPSEQCCHNSFTEQICNFLTLRKLSLKKCRGFEIYHWASSSSTGANLLSTLFNTSWQGATYAWPALGSLHTGMSGWNPGSPKSPRPRRRQIHKPAAAMWRVWSLQ